MTVLSSKGCPYSTSHLDRGLVRGSRHTIYGKGVCIRYRVIRVNQMNRCRLGSTPIPKLLTHSSNSVTKLTDRKIRERK
jgi:hypothetical protein